MGHKYAVHGPYVERRVLCLERKRQLQLHFSYAHQEVQISGSIVASIAEDGGLPESS
jgi:hypothetical protein